MDPITFDEIPFDWLEPGTFLEVRPNYADVGILPYPARVLIVGQKLAGGTLAEGQVRQVTRAGEAEQLFGAGSIGAEQVNAFRKANTVTPLFVTALEDAAGAVKAAGTVTFAGTVPAATVLRFRINNRQVRITAGTGDAVADMASALADAINAETALPVTAAAAAAVVTVTCRHGGEVGNEIDLRIDAKAQPVPDGLTVTIAGMSNGAGNPDGQTALDAVINDWYTQVQWPWNDPTNMTALAADMARRYQAMSKLDCHAFVGKRGTFGEQITFGALTNSPFITKSGLDRSPSSPWALSAVCCAVATFHLTNDPARQLKSLPLPGITAPDEVDRFIEEEQNLLLQAGISTFDHLPDGTTTISRMITSYKVSNLETADRAWLDIMVPATMSRIRYDWAAYVSLLYPRAKLIADEDTAAFISPPGERNAGEGNSVVTPKRMYGSWAGRCRLYADRVWIQQAERTIAESVFQIDPDDDNRLNARQQVKIAGNLMVLAGALEFQV